MKAFLLVPLLIWCTWSIMPAQDLDLTKSQLYQDSAWTLLESGKYDEAEELSKKSLKIHRQVVGEDTALVHIYILIGEGLSLKGQFSAAEDSLKQGLRILTNLSLDQSYLASVVHNKLGINCEYWKSYIKAIDYYKKALSIHSNLENKDDSREVKYYNNIGAAYYGLGNSKKAIHYLKKAIDTQQKIPNSNLGDLAISYNNIAVLYNEQGYHKKAIEFYKKSSSLSLKITASDIRERASTFNNIGVAYYQLMAYEKAMTYYKKSLDLSIQAYGENHYSLISNYNNIGLTYYNLGEYETSLSYIKTALKIALEAYGKGHSILPQIYETIGLNYISLGLYDDAIHNITLALDIRRKKKLRNVYHSYFHLSSAYYSKKEYLKASQYCKKALELLMPKEEKINPYSNTFDHYTMMRVLRLQAINYKKLANANSEMYEDSTQMAYNELYNFHNYLQVNYPEKMTQKKYLSLSFDAYEGAIDLLQGDFDKAFQIAEKSKSRQLIASFRQAEAERFANVPDGLLDKEYKLQLDISYYKKKKKEVIQLNSESKDSLIQIYNDTLFAIKRKKDLLIQTFKDIYPSYYQLKYNHEVVDVTTIQQHLSKNQTMVEYFLGENTLFTFVIGKDHYKIQKTSIDSSFKSLINNLKSSILDYWLLPDQGKKKYELDKEQFMIVAQQLYQILLAPIETLLTENLIIIPDGLLHYIPFDALLTGPVNTSTDYALLPYAIKKYQISYSYSATLNYYLNQLPPSSAHQNVLAIAPQFSDSIQEYKNVEDLRKGLGMLPYNNQEAWAVVKILGGTAMTGTDVSSQALIDHAKGYKIIHLATHAKANDRYGEDSFLTFGSHSDTLNNTNRIYTHELYNLQLDADMVVLSTCESGLGTLQKGEGIISLARAFIFAKARSTIASLWGVSDLTTSQIMTFFYKNIKAGMPKDEALRKAKLTYLNTSSRTAPFYWASFIPTGNMDPIKFKNNNFKNLYTIVGICLFLFLGYIYRSRKNN